MHLNTFPGKTIETLLLLAYGQLCGEGQNDCCEEKSLKPIQEHSFLQKKFQPIQPGNVALNREGNCELAHTGLDISQVFFPRSCSLAVLLGTSVLSDRDCEYSETSGKRDLRKKSWQTRNYLIYFLFLLQSFFFFFKKSKCLF